MPPPLTNPPPPGDSGPLPLSVSIVCRNNEQTIGRTLESVAGLASEIVAVDSGSTDGTIALLERHGARVIRSAWLGHVKTKQLALSQCDRPWVLCVDSDESVEPDLARSIRQEALRAQPGAPGFEVNRKVYYRGRPLNHAWQPERRLRLVRRGQFRWAGLDPHDYLELIPGAPGVDGGHIGRLAGTLRHDSITTFAEFFVKQAAHSRVMAASLHAAGKRGSYWRLATSPAGALLKQLVLKRAFLDGYAGWLAAASTAAGALMKHAALIELSRGEGERET
jgi:glycosyltransferase involved in cell wall biosynthesis